MAVYKRTYRGYSGPLTNPMWRFLVLQRFAFRAIFKSRFLFGGYSLCFFFPLLTLCAVYVNQNAAVLGQVGLKAGFFSVNSTFFLNFLVAQGVQAGLVTAFVGPSLVAPDLTNGGLPLYLSRPLSRSEYILGKGVVLGSLIGAITLLPALLLFVVQSSLVGFDWFSSNLFLANGIILGGGVMMAVLILLGLAMSAWVRWRIVAGALILGSFVAGKGFGAVVNAVMRTSVGYYLDLQHLLSDVAADLMRHPAPDEAVPAWAAWIALLVFCGLLLALINRKLRVCEAA